MGNGPGGVLMETAMDVLCGLLALAFAAGVLWWLIETRRARRLDAEEKAQADAQAKAGGGGGPEPKR